MDACATVMGTLGELPGWVQAAARRPEMVLVEYAPGEPAKFLVLFVKEKGAPNTVPTKMIGGQRGDT